MEPMRQFEEIEPFCKWQKDKANDILEIHIQGFRKEHLRVQLHNAGILVITGERVLDQTRGTKFRKELRVPEDCKRNEIKAKLTGGVLYITMPKKSDADFTSERYGLPDQQNQEQIGKQKPEERVGPSDHSKMQGQRRFMFGLKRPQMDGNSALKLGALAAVMVVVSVGAYIVYKYHKSLHGDNY